MEALERRLDGLERRILGPDPGSGKRHSVPKESVVSSLVTVAKTCGNAVERKDRIAPLLRRTQELERYLDPNFGEEYGGVAPEVKVDLILAREDKIKEVGEMLEKVKKAKEVLNGKGFEKVSELEPKMKELRSIQIAQLEKESELSEDTLGLIGQYNEIMETLSKTFVMYDKVLKEAEDKADPKKKRDE